jgi:Domain of unknown function (DUF4372)/Transposase DDE domain
MNQGKYIFSQIVEFIPQRHFERIMTKYKDRIGQWSLTSWNQLLVLMFGQLDGCNSLRELTDITTAHARKSFHLGFGRTPINRTQLSRVNQLRDYHIFEEFAYHMVKLAQKTRIDKEFELNGKFYAFDSTTIDLCMSLFEWARFRSTKSGIKVHTQLDVVTQIPVSFNITEAAIHDVNAMDWINYEPLACYIFDRGYWDLDRLFRIELLNSFFVIREKRRPKFEVVAGEDLLEGTDNVLRDQTVRFTTKGNAENYPSEIRRIVYYEPELKRTFTYYTNNFYLKAKDIAFIYKNRWVVEIFFKWMKSHLRIKFFWGNTENSVRIQVYVAIITYCAVAIIERKLELNRSTFEVMRILNSSLLAKDNLKDLFQPVEAEQTCDDGQLKLNFESC